MKFINFIKGILKDNLRKKIISSTITVVLLLVAVVVIIFAYGMESFGWFAENKEVNATGMSVTVATDDLDVYVYDEEMTNLGKLSQGSDINFNLNLPGTSKYFVLEFNNTKNEEISISKVGFLEPTSQEEIPVVENNINYYFSTQVLVISKNLGNTKPTAENLSSNFTSSEVGDFLTTTPAEGENINLTSFTIWEETISDQMIIAPNDRCYLVIKITFYNNPDAPQNQYRNFGTASSITPAACCKRRIFIEI